MAKVSGGGPGATRRRYSMTPFGQFLPGDSLRQAVGPYGRVVPVVVGLGLLSALLEGLGIGLMIPFLEILVSGRSAGQGAVVPGSGMAHLFLSFAPQLAPATRLVVIAVAMVSLILLKNLVGFANATLSAWLYGKAGHAVRQALARRLTEVGYPFFVRESPGRLLNLLSTESWRVSDAAGVALNMLISGAAALILLVFLTLLSWKLTAAVALGLGVIQLVQAAVTRQLKQISGVVTARNSELASRMLHLVEGARLLRVFGREASERARFDKVSDEVRRQVLRVETRRAMTGPVMEVLYAVLLVAVIVGAWRSGIAFAVVAAFVVLLYRMQPHVRNMQAASAQLHSLSGSLRAVDALLDPAGKPVQLSGAQPAPRGDLAITFDRVSFAFPGEAAAHPVLKEVTFHIAPARSTALVGRSGTGKTTLVNLLCRFLEPDSGEIRINDAPLTALDALDWRERIALASEDLGLMEGTVAENIAYGREGASPEEVREAARLADAESFIEKLPDGYDTVLGYRGVNLSAGQRQRIGLARALLRDPEILILDEATNAVDGISERAILQTLKSRAGRRTTIVVSHHRRTLAACDEVVILNGGRVAASTSLHGLEALDMEALYAHGDNSHAA